MKLHTLVVLVTLDVLLVAVGLVPLADACPLGATPALPGEGHGLWQRQDCTWEILQCPPPGAFADETRAVRLPHGCIAPPRITYSAAEDEVIRKELAENFTRVALLTDEVARGRKAFADAMAINTAQVQGLEQRTDRAEDARDKATRDAVQLRSDLTNWKIGGIAGGALALCVGGVIGLIYAASP